jgi:hypothetical protein
MSHIAVYKRTSALFIFAGAAGFAAVYYYYFYRRDREKKKGDTGRPASPTRSAFTTPVKGASGSPTKTSLPLPVPSSPIKHDQAADDRQRATPPPSVVKQNVEPEQQAETLDWSAEMERYAVEINREAAVANRSNGVEQQHMVAKQTKPKVGFDESMCVLGICVSLCADTKTASTGGGRRRRGQHGATEAHSAVTTRTQESPSVESSHSQVCTVVDI